MTYSEDKAQREKERAQDASMENEASPPTPMVQISLKEYDKLKAKQHYITDKSMIDIIKSEDWIEYTKDLDLAKTLVDQWGYIKQRLNAQHLRLKECTGNLQFYKQDGQNHVDGDKGEVACILMLADEYIDGDIGGEFYNETQKVTVPFKQGRLMVFDAADLHRGTSFNKENMARLSIKWVGTPLTNR